MKVQTSRYLWGSQKEEVYCTALPGVGVRLVPSHVPQLHEERPFGRRALLVLVEFELHRGADRPTRVGNRFVVSNQMNQRRFS
jgi:hypothetical protein